MLHKPQISKPRKKGIWYLSREAARSMGNKQQNRGYQKIYHSIVDMVYIIKINFIGKGYSAAELSFPFDIFNHCRKVTGKDIRPRLLEKTLDVYTETSKFPRLKKCRHKELGFVYKKISRKVN